MKTFKEFLKEKNNENDDIFITKEPIDIHLNHLKAISKNIEYKIIIDFDFKIKYRILDYRDPYNAGFEMLDFIPVSYFRFQPAELPKREQDYLASQVINEYKESNEWKTYKWSLDLVKSDIYSRYKEGEFKK
jgi:hypothetical protein